MPTLWGDLTTDEATIAAGFSTKSHRASIIKRIHAQKQPATTGKCEGGPGWRYWITIDELEQAMTRWPRNAKKARGDKPDALRSKTNAHKQ